MARILFALVLGVLVGVTAVLLLRPAPLALPDLGDLRPSVTATAAPTNAVVSAAAREGGPDFYRRLAEANGRELASMISQAAAEPSSTERELALAVLLKRYSELDALGAVRRAREAGVGGMALSAVYGAWARAAPGQALAALSTVESPDAAATVAIALIAALGNDAAAIGRVAAVLTAREGEEPFPSAAAAGPAVAGVAAAFAAPRSALGLAAQRWADLDPRRAFTVARAVDDARLRLMLETAALRALARIAPDEALAHVATLGSSASQQLGVLGGTLVELARADPERLLTATAGLPTDARRIAEQAALQQLASRDPAAALRYVERMPLGVERQAMTQLVARNYGKQDATAALAWARSQPSREELVAVVLGGVAEEDPNRALDLALALTSPIERVRAVQHIAMTGARHDATAEAVADRLLTIDDPQLRENMAFSVSMWASRSPDRAMSWLLANSQTAPPNVFMPMGQQLAMHDPRNAIAYSAQIPAAAREQWIQGVAHGYVQNDPLGAIDWLAQFRGEEWYGRAASALAMTVAQRDGAAAARLIEGVDTERTGNQGLHLTLTLMIVTNWANQDPAAAAEWGMDRPTEQERMTAVGNVLGTWSNEDAAGARQWTLRLPQGAIRDSALTRLLTTAASQRSGGLDPGMLNGFSSDSARQQAVLQVVQGLAQRDPAAARAVVNGYLTEPSLRAQAERMLDAGRNDTSGRPQFPIEFGVRQ